MAAESSGPTPGQGSYREVSAAQLVTDRADGKVAVLIDVRTQAEFDGGHAPGAVHLPLDQLESRRQELNRYAGGDVYLICRSGARSANAGQYLAHYGFDAVNVAGGTLAWVGIGQPVE